VRYFVIANEPERRDRWAEELVDHGFEVTEEYHSDAIIITLGGDGSILHAARNYEDPTILPVLAGRSEGNRSRLDSNELLAALDSLEEGDRTLTRTTYDRISAYRDGKQLRGGYQALNEISLHHRSPVLGAVFAVRIRDGDEIQEFERVIGDGVLVATPFGATGYYRSITGGTFAEGLGIAFNNIHKPQGMPVYRVCSRDAVVELELLKTSRSSGAVLTRDNDDEMYELPANSPIEIRRSEKTVDIVDIE
jgi:NAD kinase